MACFKHCRKWTVLIFNLIFALLGVVLIIWGAISTATFNDLNKVVPSSYRFFSATPIVLIVLGTIIILISIFATIGVLKKNACLLTAHTIILVVFFVLQIILSIVTFVAMSKQDGLAVGVNMTVHEVFNNRSSNMELIDFMQTKLECCGPDGPDFWGTGMKKVPKSCREDGDTSKLSYKTSCQEALKDFLLNIVQVVGITILVLAPIHMIGATLSLSLANAIRNHNRRYNKYTK